jgi:segregation and condensation protein B
MLTHSAVLPYRPLASLRPLSRRQPRTYSRLANTTRGVVGRGPLARDADLAAVEAALFAADEPLTGRKLAAVAGLGDAGQARRLVRRLQTLYEVDGSAFQIEELAGGFQLLTRPEFHYWLARLRQSRQDVKLSGPARETLAIVAYRQPIMRADIEAVRGVQCGDMLRVLMEKGLVRIAGRHPSLGRPVLYGTTRKFLQVFGLKSLDELPNAAQLRPPDEDDVSGGSSAEGAT